jgi:hypothetical protein
MRTHDFATEQLARIQGLLDDARRTRASLVHPRAEVIRQLIVSLDAMLKELRGVQFAVTSLEAVPAAQERAA